MTQGVKGGGKAKGEPGAVAKASPNRALVAILRLETRWPTHGQDETGVKACGGPNRLREKTHRMNCG